jgi:hypothetical protein
VGSLCPRCDENGPDVVGDRGVVRRYPLPASGSVQATPTAMLLPPTGNAVPEIAVGAGKGGAGPRVSPVTKQ